MNNCFDRSQVILRKHFVLSVRPKITDLNFHLFARNIHPELFEVCASRTLVRENYSLKLNITTDGHAIAFLHDSMVLTEVSAGAHHPLPANHVLLSQRHPRCFSNNLTLICKTNFFELC